MLISDQLARHLSALRFEQLPRDVVAAAKRLILDTLGTAWAGAGEAGCREALAVTESDGAAARASIWANGGGTSPAGAAFVNGTFAAALDYDSLHFEAITHPEIVTLPAALALGESHHRSGRDLLTAIVAGGDLMCRLALSTKRTSMWFPTSTHGAFGAAAAASVVLGQDREMIQNALGLALCQAGGTSQAVIERTLAKRMLSAFAARGGVHAAQLAGTGVTGPAEAFEGPGGFYSLFEDGNPDELLDGLGERFETLNTGIKKFPSCACNHAVIEGTLRLMSKHALAPDDVIDAVVRISPYMNTIVGAPYDPSNDAQVAAQFSAQYSVASAVRRGRVGLDDLTVEAARDPEVGALANQVRVEVDEGNQGLLAPATVILATADGRYKEEVLAIPGSADAALSDEDVRVKFTDCAARGPVPMSPTQANRMIDVVDELEKLDDLSMFFANAGS